MNYKIKYKVSWETNEISLRLAYYTQSWYTFLFTIYVYIEILTHSLEYSKVYS